VCIVSSDSDFTRLAVRIRESGLIVHGFGARKTPQSFIAACDTFVHIENLAGYTPPTPAVYAVPAVATVAVLPSAPLSAPAASRPAAVPPAAVPPAAVPPAAVPPAAVPPASASPVAAPPAGPRRTAAPPAAAMAARPPARATELKDDTVLIAQLRDAVGLARDPDGWARLASVGHLMNRHQPFTPRAYGYAKLRSLMAATTLFDVECRSPGEGRPAVVYVRDKRFTPRP